MKLVNMHKFLFLQSHSPMKKNFNILHFLTVSSSVISALHYFICGSYGNALVRAHHVSFLELIKSSQTYSRMWAGAMILDHIQAELHLFAIILFYS